MKKVVVGMSGGVDSSVAAHLLKQQGYEVIGVTMQIWQEEQKENVEEDGGCCGLSAVEDARRVAQSLEIPYYVMNFRDEFRRSVIDYFVEEYKQGRTPNPCIACNRYVKWEALLDRSLAIGADFIATGHYARVAKLPNGRYSIKTSKTAAKDQTYALYNLTQEQLSRTLMPVGEYTKEEIRTIAEEIGLSVSKKPDSMEICFVPDNDYAGFIREYTKETEKPGNFVNTAGEVLGKHKGIVHYTVGQRKGLGIAFGSPMFVVEIRPETNEVVLGTNAEVMSETLFATQMNAMSVPAFEDGMRFLGKVRYSHQGAMCTVREDKNGICRIVFDEPQRAITPGQAVVLYEEDGCVAGGGTIVRAGK